MAATVEQRAAASRAAALGMPFYTVPSSEAYLCGYCHEPIPEGCEVVPVTDTKGKTVGVVASADPNPYTDAQFLHRCGKGTTQVPEALAHHDRHSDQAAAIRAAQAAPNQEG